jgi:hypothetical protein
MNLDNLKLLDQFTGGDTYYINPIGNLRYTEGVKFLADNADCYWRIDAIASYQHKLLHLEMQLWELTVKPDHTCTLLCREDSGIEPVVRQEIEFTDFPLPAIRLWVEQDVLNLPSEHWGKERSGNGGECVGREDQMIVTFVSSSLLLAAAGDTRPNQPARLSESSAPLASIHRCRSRSG